MEAVVATLFPDSCVVSVALAMSMVPSYPLLCRGASRFLRDHSPRKKPLIAVSLTENDLSNRCLWRH